MRNKTQLVFLWTKTFKKNKNTQKPFLRISATSLYAYLKKRLNTLKTLKPKLKQKFFIVKITSILLCCLVTPATSTATIYPPTSFDGDNGMAFTQNCEISDFNGDGFVKCIKETNSTLFEGDIIYSVENYFSDSQQSFTTNKMFIPSQSNFGDSCANPIDISANAKINGRYIFNVDNTAGSKFYSYTASEHGFFRMNSCLNPGGTVRNSSMKVYKENCGNLEWEGDDNCHGMTTYDGEIQEGETYIFEWDNEEQGIFEARFYFYQPVAGMTCDDAIPLVAGLNTVNYYLGPQYFSFTAEVPGTIHVSTCGLMDNVWDIYKTKLYETCDAPAPVKVSKECIDIYEDVQMELTYHVETGGNSYILVLREMGHWYWDYKFEFSFTPDCVGIEVTEDTIVCGSYDFNGNTLVTSGAYFETFTNQEGCDSSVTLNLTVNQAYNIEENISICQGETYTLPDGSEVDTEGTYTNSFLTKTGCDSIYTINLTVNQNYDIEENISICQGETYTLPNGNETSSKGTYTSSLFTTNGCDSIVTTNLSIGQDYRIENNASICQGETYTLPDGNEAGTEGTYTNSFLTKTGCDSIITTKLTVNQSYQIEESISICQGETYTLPDGSEVDTEGTYTNSFLTKTGCDSIITTNLTLGKSYEIHENISICLGETYTLPDGNLVSTEGTYTSSLKTLTGCDSIITTNLSILQPISTVSEIVLCSGENYTFPDGTTETNIITNTNHKSILISGMSGCDSTITTNITIITVNTTVTVDGNIFIADNTTADSYQWYNCELNLPVDGETNNTFTATKSGNYAVVIEDNSCIDTSDCYSFVVSGIEESENIIQTIWPNPTQGMVTILLRKISESIDLSIMDIYGKVVSQQIITTHKNRIQINLPEKSGTYFIRLESGGRIDVFKIIKID